MEVQIYVNLICASVLLKGATKGHDLTGMMADTLHTIQ